MSEQKVESRIVAVAGPGSGIARQYRVQVQQGGPNSWQLYERFTTHEEAQRCAAILDEQGKTTRIIRYSLCPAAA